jgi:cyclopropane fatty-acyl-phospholipid synthase-like methyltransferase
VVSIKSALEKTADHDAIYDEKYYEKVDSDMEISAGIMSMSIFDQFHPGAVIDVGCGTGSLLLALRDLGVRAKGIEHSRAALKLCHERGLDVAHHDLESNDRFEEKSDVVTSTEVAEHLPKRFADRYVDLLCTTAPVVVITAATPGQRGTDHVNEQPHEYWIEKFQQRDFRFEDQITATWRASWREKGVANCYCSNVLVFTKRDGN